MVKPVWIWNESEWSGVLFMSGADDFEAMMRANGPKVYTLAVRLAGNLADGQDLAQETFVNAYKHWDQFRGDSDVATWLYRICMNCWKNRVRYEKRRSFWKHFSLERGRDEKDAPLDLPAEEAPTGAALERQDEQAALQRAMARLDPEDRAILVLRELEEKSYEDIAADLGVPLGTVKSRLARSRDKLRELLEKEQASHGT